MTAARASSPVAGLRDTVGSEWVKLVSLRSSRWAFVAAFALTIGISVLVCRAYVARQSGLSLLERLTFDPASLSVGGVALAQVAVGVAGVAMTAGEHAAGTIRLTYLATPRRLRVLVAKVLVLVAVTFAVGLATGVSSFSAGQAVLSSAALSTSFCAPGSAHVVVGVAVYFVGIALFGLCLGAVVRRSAGAVAGLFGVVLVAPLIVITLPSPWNDEIARYLPSAAGLSLLHTLPRPDLLAPGPGVALYAGYVAAFLVVAAVATVRRDA